MKRVIKVIDNVNGKVAIAETELRNLAHFQVQLRDRANVYRDRTKYTRKEKHKKRLTDYYA